MENYTVEHFQKSVMNRPFSDEFVDRDDLVDYLINFYYFQDRYNYDDLMDFIFKMDIGEVVSFKDASMWFKITRNNDDN